jgi:hypothetical protein
MQVNNNAPLYSIMPTIPNEIIEGELADDTIEHTEPSNNQENNSKKDFNENNNQDHKKRIGGEIDIFA